MKKCNKCRLKLPLKNFINGRNNCKTCVSIWFKEYYQKNKNKISKSVKKYRLNNKDKIKKQKQLYREKNKDKIKLHKQIYNKKNKKKLILRGKEYRIKNKDIIRQKKRQYGIKNKEKIAIKSKQYYIKNKTKINQYILKKIKTNTQYKLASYLRRRMHCALKRNYKSGSAVRDLGCPISELKIYLEKQFIEDMSWDNYGKWHVDHKMPLASFNLTNREQFLKAVHYSNLQPMWAHDNLSKGCKIYPIDKS